MIGTDVSVTGPARAPSDLLCAAQGLLTVDPAAWPLIEGINNFILEGDLYKALKEAKKLIAHEKEILDRAAQEQVRKSA